MAKSTKTYLPRPLILLVTVGLVLAGIVILTRVFFLSFPSSALGKIASDLPLNNPLSDGQALGQSDTKQTTVWGEGITNSFSKPATKGVWISVGTAASLLVGEVVEGQFRVKYSMPPTTISVRLFSDGSAMYFTEDELFTVSNSLVQSAYTADAGWRIGSVFFEATQKVFYLILSQDTQAKLVALDSSKRLTTNFNGKVGYMDQIRNVDISQNLLYFFSNSTTVCHSLDLVNKLIRDLDCKVVVSQTSANSATLDVDHLNVYDVSGHKLKTVATLPEHDDISLLGLDNDLKLLVATATVSGEKRLWLETDAEPGWKEIEVEGCQQNCTYRPL